LVGVNFQPSVDSDSWSHQHTYVRSPRHKPTWHCGHERWLLHRLGFTKYSSLSNSSWINISACLDIYIHTYISPRPWDIILTRVTGIPPKQILKYANLDASISTSPFWLRQDN
jgi:hypothetical protein